MDQETRRERFRLGALPWILALLLGAGAAEAGGRLPVLVSIPPQAELVERIGGELVEVEVLLRPGQSPATYEPTLKQMARLGRARLYLRIGVPFETGFLPRLRSAHPDLPVVDLREGIELRALEPGGEEHHPGHDHGHDAGELDPHVWLSPRLARRLAENAAAALAGVDPAHQATYTEGRDRLLADLEALDRRLSAALAPLAGRDMYVFHPAFGYLARDYGLRQRAIETGGREPGPRHLHHLISRARAEGVRVIFVQPQFSSKAARTVAEAIGGAVVPLDPLARDYLANLEEMARTIREALTGEASGRKAP